MDLDFLDKLLDTRKNEIIQGKNACTANPLYVVLDLNEQFCKGFNDYSMLLNLKDVKEQYGYLDMGVDCEEREFSTSDKGMISPEEVTSYKVDRFVAFFLTRSGAEAYLKYQSHNLNEPYIYTFNVGYRNQEMNNLLGNEYYPPKEPTNE